MNKQIYRFKKFFYKVIEYFHKRFVLSWGDGYTIDFKMSNQNFSKIDIPNLEGYINSLVEIESKEVEMKLDYTYRIGTVNDDFLYSLVTIEIIIRKRI